MILVALQDEINALIEKQQKLMTRLIEEQVIWGEERANASLSPAELRRQIEILDSDSIKVRALESTVAVIGTMKAGKSTTINALIGEEVLPHRLTAMTTLPTLIRHKPGQKDPVLKLHKLDVFRELVEEVKGKVDAAGDNLAEHSKINEAFSTVKSRSANLREEYVGKEAIHQALFLINDTFRLAGHEMFDVDLSQYIKYFTNISSLPTVEIEFRCLADKPESLQGGSLALLDTPGPNEAGQSNMLKNILSEQIEKNASMVLLVMNYTQLNTEQDSNIRSQIRDIKEVFRDRSFVVVNRFDERKSNDLDSEMTTKLASSLLNDSIDDDSFITPGEVFPVSSHYAFIVEKAFRKLQECDELIDFLKDPENRDFIYAAFGPTIEEDEIEELSLQDIERKCSRLFKRSGYQPFTSKMLEKAYAKAGESSLQAALARLNDNAIKLDRFSTAVGGGLSQEMSSLMESVERTRNLSKSIETVYNRLDEVKEVGISEYRNSAQASLADHVSDVKDRISREFMKERQALLGKLEGELQEKSSKKEEQKLRAGMSRKSRKQLDLIERDLENLREDIKKRSQDGEGILDFGTDKQAATIFHQKASDVINVMFNSMVGSLQEQLNLLEEKTQTEIQSELFGQLEKLCHDYEGEMEEKGFQFNVSLSDSFSLEVLSDDFVVGDADNAFETYKKKEKKSQTVNVPREGWVHNVLKILSLGFRDDYEQKVETRDNLVTSYRVFLDKYVSHCEQIADRFYNNVNGQLEKQFEEKLVPTVDDVFSKAIDAVKGIEEALEKSKKLKSDNMAVISDVKDMMIEIKKDNALHMRRVNVARSGIDRLLAR